MRITEKKIRQIVESILKDEGLGPQGPHGESWNSEVAATRRWRVANFLLDALRTNTSRLGPIARDVKRVSLPGREGSPTNDIYIDFNDGNTIQVRIWDV